MPRLQLRAYGPLNDFVIPSRRQRTLVVTLDGPTTAKDLAESAGIPHVEIALVVVNHEPSGFDRLLGDGDRVAVFPRFFAIDVDPPGSIRQDPAPPRFVLDVHLGRLARHLRLAGLDTLYATDSDDETLAIAASTEQRTLLTRDVGLLKRRIVGHGYWLRSRDPHEQFVEVLRRFDPLPIAPFSRCLRCNGVLHQVDKADVIDRLPPRVRERDDSFRRCGDCGRTYWKGTHYDRLTAALGAALEQAASGRPS